MLKKLNLRILIILVFINLGLNQAFGQEDTLNDSKKNQDIPEQDLAPKQKVKVVDSRKKPDKSFKVFVKFDLPLVYTSNAFRTPSEKYVDPETGNWTTTSPTSAFFLNPSAIFGGQYNFIKNHGIAIELQLEETQFIGNEKLKDANGNVVNFERGYKGRFEGHRWHFGYQIETSNYNYLHRGTGTSRVTKVKESPLAQRYKYTSSGTFISYRYKIKKGSYIYFEIKNYHKDYKEVEIFQSLDRDEDSYRLAWSQLFDKDYQLKVSHKKLTKKYTTHEAENAYGKQVPGTDKILVDTSNSLKFGFLFTDYSITPYFKLFESKDTYADYWSYKEQTSGGKIRYKPTSNQKITINASQSNRTYAKETNSLGELRKRRTTDYKLNWQYTINKTSNAYITLNSHHQDDVDGYYSYNRKEFIIGYATKF